MTRTEFFNALKAGAVWDVGVSIHRTNPLPLDQLEIFETEQDLQTYIKTNKLAYPGQIVTLLEGNTTTVYVVEEVGTDAKLKELAATDDTNAALTKIENLLGYGKDYSGDSVKTQLDSLKSNAIVKGKTSNVLLVNGSDSGKTIGWEPGNTSEEGKQIPTAANVRSYVTSNLSYYVQGSKIEAINDAPTHQEIPSALAVKNYVDLAVTGASKYLGPVGTLAALNGLSPDSKGDFARASANFNFADGTSVHAGDLLICEDVAKKTWSIIHGETDQILSIVGGAGLTVDDTDVHNPVIAHSNSVTAVTETAEETQALDYGEEFGIKQYSYDAQGHITGSVSKQLKLPNEPTLAGLGGITPAQVDTKISTAVNNLDVAEVKVGADQTLTAISQVDGKIKATATKIAIETSQVNGLNSALEKLDGLNNYVLPPSTTTTLGGIIVGDNLTITETGKLSAIDTTYEDATTTTHGLMSTADKVKLNGIEEGANKTIVDASLSSTSTNPVQNKAVHAEFNSVRTALTDASSGLQSQIDNHATLIGNKVDKVEGKGLSTNDFTTAEKNKLAGLKNYTLPVASEGALGGIKVGYSGTTAKTYAVKLDANNRAYVEVPWQNTTYTNGNGLTLTGTVFSLNVASSAMHGGIKLYNDKLNKEITPQAASEVNGRYYRIQLDNANRAFVNVPWTDTDNNTFRPIQVDAAQTDAMATLNLKSGTNIALALEHGSESENVTINHTGPGSASQSSASATASDGGTVAFGGEFYVPTFAIDANGHTRDLGRIKYKLPTPETYSLQIATTTTLGGIKSGNEANNFVARSGGEGHIGNVPNYEAEVVVNPTTGIATVNLEAMAGPETQWSIVAGNTVLGIREVSTDKLVQGTNTLIINGGGAAW